MHACTKSAGRGCRMTRAEHAPGRGRVDIVIESGHWDSNIKCTHAQSLFRFTRSTGETARHVTGSRDWSPHSRRARCFKVRGKPTRHRWGDEVELSHATCTMPRPKRRGSICLFFPRLLHVSSQRVEARPEGHEDQPRALQVLGNAGELCDSGKRGQPISRSMGPTFEWH